MITLEINGLKREVPEDTSLGHLIGILGLEPERIAVELNEAIIPRAHYAQTPLAEGDSLEIVQFVGGG